MTQHLRPSDTTHRAHRPHGADTLAVPTGLGLSPAEPTTLREEGVV
ncbi:hypothetical protein [Streptomyces longisporus]|uniref:Uncharacterized protein n=1 Tax=Streptomyces longisporus TaxID=1948 RepID=A0ABP5ZZV5_STRLO